MEIFIVIVCVLFVIGYLLYRSGKRIGSIKGFGVGLSRARRRLYRRGRR